MIAKQGHLPLDFSFFNGGYNCKDPQCGIKQNQAYTGTINARFKSKGFDRAPGFLGIAETPVFTTYCKGIEFYNRIDGTDLLMGFSGGKLYSVNTATGAITELYNLTGSAEGYGVSAFDRFFAVNGASACVVEGDSSYTIGIAPPEGVTAEAAASGSLPDGVYKLYAGYARTVSGLNVQFSEGQEIADVTLGTGNNTIAISNFANSTDARVSNKVIWATDANGGTYYLYHETEDNETESFNITSTAGKNSSVLYRVWGAPSKQPPTMTGIFFHDNRLFGWKDNVLYASMKATTVYDLERWPDIQYEFPFYILSLFSIGPDLFINTNKGIIKLPYADMSARWEWVTKRLYFKYPRTVAKLDNNSGDEYNEPVIGLTNDGVRIFDGTGFSIDLSKDVKPDIKRAYDGASAVFTPAGFVYRTKDRSEYHLSYRDLTINAVTNNRRLVLNLDSLTIASNTDYLTAWEPWEIGFTHSAIDSSGNLYMAQSLNGNSQIFIEQWGSVADKWVYGSSGQYITESTNKTCKVVSRMDITDIAGRVRWEQARTLIQLQGEASIKVNIGEAENLNATHTFVTGDESLFDVARFDVDVFSSEQPVIGVSKLEENLKGASVFVTYEQTADDINMQTLEIKLYGTYEQGRDT